MKGRANTAGPRSRRRVPAVVHAAIGLTVALCVSGGVLMGGYRQATSAAASLVTIKPGITGKCMDDFHDGTANLNKVDIYACNGTAAQQWRVAGTTIRINGRCLDVFHSGTTNGTHVDLFACNNTGAQSWVKRGNWLLNPESNRCLDDPGWSRVNGSPLDIWACVGQANETWTMARVAPPAPTPSAQPTGAPTRTAAAPGAPGFHLIFTDHFATNVPLGAFTDCNHNTDQSSAFCGGLAPYPGVEANWWAYPAGWPDTATQLSYPVGGYYDPATTVSISGGEMHIRMWRGSSGSVHSATVVPKAAMGMRYGAYTETFRVLSAARGYKSAHLLWPSGTCSSCEIDFPEDSWDTTISAFNHPKGGGAQDAFDNGTRWTGWHTTTIQWTPGDVKFFLDGSLMGESTRGVMDSPANWDIQNESSIDGESAALNSSAQMDISSVSVYSYTP